MFIYFHVTEILVFPLKCVVCVDVILQVRLGRRKFSCLCSRIYRHVYWYRCWSFETSSCFSRQGVRYLFSGWPHLQLQELPYKDSGSILLRNVDN